MFKNWQTTLGGIISMVGLLLPVAGVTSQKLGDAIAAVGVVVVGATAKDHNVTGGTKPQ